MPSRKKERKMSCKNNPYNYSTTLPRRRRKNRVFQGHFTDRIPKYLNDMVFDNKFMTIKSKESWKVVPKDSCEVYKDRRKRRIDAQRKEEEVKDDVSNQENIVKQKEDKKKTRRSLKRTRVERRRNKRRDNIDSSTSNSTMSYCSCSVCMDYE